MDDERRIMRMEAQHRFGVRAPVCAPRGLRIHAETHVMDELQSKTHHQVHIQSPYTRV
jgi:hypothetical protein